MNEETTPLFQQIARLIEDLVVDGTYRVGDRVHSSNELAKFHQINPATARRGLALLASSGVLEKRRGVGMFVTAQAASIIQKTRREEFAEVYVVPLIDEAAKLGLSRQETHSLIERVAETRGLYLSDLAFRRWF